MNAAKPTAIVIGSGFAGAVTACRLAESGQYDVCLLERGRRYESGDFPAYPTDALLSDGDATHQTDAPVPDFSRWLWNRDHGIYDVRDLDSVVSVQAAGYGGGTHNWGREQHRCDMRGRCCLGCDNGSKNSLDMNYLARAEDAGARIITLAEVTDVGRNKGGFTVTYNDLIMRPHDGKANTG